MARAPQTFHGALERREHRWVSVCNHSAGTIPIPDHESEERRFVWDLQRIIGTRRDARTCYAISHDQSVGTPPFVQHPNWVIARDRKTAAGAERDAINGADTLRFDGEYGTPHE